MKKRPFFSVIIATYNRERLLNRALQSLLKQTEDDWEAVVIDDGSTDGTADLVREYKQRIPEKLTYVKQSNLGVVTAKNAGIACVNGRYITFLDSDDTYEPTHLSSRRDLLTQHPAIDFLHGGVTVIGSSYVPDVERPGEKIHLSKCAISGTFFIKTDWGEPLKFTGEALGTDADFMKRAQASSRHIVKTTEPTYVYHRDTPQSITSNFNLNHTG